MVIIKKEVSNDETIKYYFKPTIDKNDIIESCLLKLSKHGTVICVSSQIGCSQKCKFCAVGKKPFIRNLTQQEIFEQVYTIILDQPEYFINGFQVTFMGSGEPLCNIENILEISGRFLKSYETLRKINISTTLPSLDIDLNKFLFLTDKSHLQYSLHYVYDKKRRDYFNFNLPSIRNSISYLNKLSNKLNDTFSINYILFDGINDSDEEAEELINIVKNSNAYIKISEACKINNSRFVKSRRFEEFIQIIENSGLHYEVFRSYGQDINAGCGQFYNDSII